MMVRGDITSSTDALSLTQAPTLSRSDPWIRLGFATIAIVCCAVWAVTRSLNAPDTFTVAGTIKELGQHIPVKAPNGAKVSRLLVRNGDRVSAGQPLAQIDDANIRRDFEAASVRLTDLLITEQRILAQRDKKLSLPIPAGIDLTDTMTAKIFAENRDKLAKSLASASEEKASVRDMIKRSQAEAAEVAKQLTSRLKERDLNERELANSQPLFERNYVNRLRFGQLERESIRIGTEIAKLRTEMAKIKASRADIEARLSRSNEDTSQSAVPELDRVRSLLIDATEARNNLATRLELGKILSPMSGVVRGIKTNDAGQNIMTDRELMRITSGNDGLVIEAAVVSDQAAKLSVGTSVSIEFLSIATRQRHTEPATISEIGIAKATSKTTSAIGTVPIQASFPFSQNLRFDKEPKWLADQSVKIIFGARTYPTLADITRPLGDSLALAFGEDSSRQQSEAHQ